MKNESTADNPISVTSIPSESAKLLRVSISEYSQSLEEKLETAEEKIKFLLRAVSELATQQAAKKKPRKAGKQWKSPYRSATRENKIRKAVKKYWKAKLMGKKVTRRWAATECDLEESALSKKDIKKVMKVDIPKAIENVKAYKLIRKIDTKSLNTLLAEVDIVLDKFFYGRIKRRSGDHPASIEHPANEWE
jgi:hypothetical protein